MKRCLFFVCLAFPLAAVAQGQPAGYGALRYDYVTATLIVPKLDRIGVEFEGSVAATKDLVVFGGYRDYKPSNRLDRSTASVGVGYRFDVRPNLDFVASLSYAENQFDRPRGKNDEQGLVLGGQLRGWLTARFELNGAIWLDDSVESGTDTVLELGGQFFSRPNWSYGGRIRSDENDNTLFLGLRFYFGASRR